MTCLVVGAQNNSYYVIGDSAAYANNKVIEGTNRENAHFIRILFDGQIIKRTPSEITEYGTKQGDIYISKTIPTDGIESKAFLHQLHKGWFSLYAYYGKKTEYYLETNKKELFKLEGEDKEYRKLMQELMVSCDKVLPIIGIVRYNEHELRELVKKYNYCNDDRIPRFTVGAFVGSISITSKTGFDAVSISSKNGLNPTYGIWLESPIEGSRFSARLEFSYNSFDVQKSELGGDTDFDFIGTMKSLSIPLTLKMNGRKTSNGLFYHAGPVVSYNFHNDFILYSSTFSGNVVTTSLVEEKFPEFMYGVIGGIGYTKYVGKLAGFGSELRYTHLSGKSGKSSSQITGFNFLLTYQL